MHVFLHSGSTPCRNPASSQVSDGHLSLHVLQLPASHPKSQKSADGLGLSSIPPGYAVVKGNAASSHVPERCKYKASPNLKTVKPKPYLQLAKLL